MLMKSGWQDDLYGPGRIVLLDMLLQNVYIFSKHSPSSLKVRSTAPKHTTKHTRCSFRQFCLAGRTPLRASA